MPEFCEDSPRAPRHRPVHHAPVAVHGRSIIVFLTVCTRRRRPCLAAPEVHAHVCDVWIRATHWLVGRYVIMPDHIHLFCSPAVLPAHRLDRWVRFWKAVISRSLDAPEGTLWQTDFWDTQLRCGDSYQRKWDYVRNNPVRTGLVKQAADWPYQGELNVLRRREQAVGLETDPPGNRPGRAGARPPPSPQYTPINSRGSGAAALKLWVRPPNS